MKRIFLISLCLIGAVSLSLQSQQDDDVLITINDHEITKDEFLRIYNKNNSVTAYDAKSLEEYLDLFINFKLKVIEAEAQGYDTVQSFVDELASYRGQLVKPYFEDEEVTEELLEEAYERTKEEVNVSHILINLPRNPLPKDTLQAWKKVMEIRKRVLKGEDFEEVAKATSDDPSVKRNGGHIGWFSAFRMVYPFESGAYNTPVGEISMPLRTRFGYHLIKVNNRRPSRGEMKVAHIMIITSPNSSEDEIQQAQDTINKIYRLLQEGKDFAELARKHSEDVNSARKGGEMPWFKSGMLPPVFEDAAYALNDSGELSPPVQTSYGWHIIKMIGKRPVSSFEELRSELENKLRRDNRGKLAEQSVIERIKNEYNFTEYEENLYEMESVLDSSIYRGNWDEARAVGMIEPLFTLGGRNYTQQDFARYLASLRPPRESESFELIIYNRYQDFKKEQIIAFEEDQLEIKYPDFRNLMQEYHDGILLFNLTDDMVWSKAISDTAGLEAFHKKKKSDYMWGERADASIYTFEDQSLEENIEKLAKKRIRKGYTKDEFINMVCPVDSVVCLNITDGKFEEEDNKYVDQAEWEKKSMKTFNEDGKIVLVVINDVLDPEPKKLQEARGLITADYQNYLEKEWIEHLRGKYSIDVNEELLRTIQQNN